MTLRVLTAACLALMAQGCEDKPAQTEDTSPIVVGVPELDKEMNAAISSARATLGDFISTLRSPLPNQKYFLIKGKFVAGNTVEHLWVADVDFDGNVFHGLIANEPKHIPELSFKQAVQVLPKNVTDWMYVQDGLLVGGYTSRILRRRMTDEQRREQDARNSYRYE